MDSLLQDFRYALRTLRRAPGYTIVVVLTLALGIGANSTIFAVVHAALLRPLPYPDPDRIVSISTVTVFGDTKLADEPSIARWADEARSFEVIAAYWSGEANLTGGAGPEHVRGASVTEGFFRVMGVTPALGRAFSEEELRYEGAPVVILGQGLWRRAFGGAADVIGRTVRLDGVDHTVIGVMPAGFAFPDSAEYWRPMRLQSTVADGSADFSYAIGRLRPGVPLEEARAELEAIRRRAEDLPERFRELGVAVVTLHERLHGDLRPGLLVLLGAVGCVLLIACANVANLLLARATTRRRELAVRSALGATRARLARQLLVECTLLALLGGAAGLLIPAWGLDVLERLAPAALARIPEIRLDAAVLGFTFVVSIATGLVFGLAPAFTASRTPVQYALKEATPTTAGWRGRSRQALVAAELALAVLLLLGAGLFLRSFHAFRAADPGFDPEGVVTARYWLPFATYPDEASQRAFRQAVLERLRAIPGVEAATITRAGPLGGFHATQQFIPPGGDPESAPTVAYVHVGTDYFRTFGIALRAGREFGEQDRPGAPSVAVVSESMARLAFPDGPAVGQTLVFAGNAYTVVGVAAEVRQRPSIVETWPMVYFPAEQQGGIAAYGVIAVRSRMDAAALTAAIRAVVRDVEPELALYGVTTMERTLEASWAPRRFQALLLGAFAALALVLAASGLYALIAYLAAQRTREIGVRIALGATRAHVLRLVLGDGALPVVVGTTLGVAGALALGRVLESQLFGVTPVDPVTYLAAPLVLAAVALLAGWLPARRALRTDPVRALRVE